MKKDLNKYKLKPSDIKKLVLLDQEAIKKKPFWRNNVVHAWCLSKEIGSEEDFEFGCESEWWLGIYDNGKIKFEMSCLGGMCSYKPRTFLNEKDIKNDNDRKVQTTALEMINKLIDDKVLGLPEGHTKC